MKILPFTALRLLHFARSYRDRLACDIAEQMGKGGANPETMAELAAVVKVVAAAEEQLKPTVPPGMHDRNGNTR